MVEHTFVGLEERAEAWTAALLAVDPAGLDGPGCERLLALVVRVGRAEAAVKARLITRAHDANRWRETGHRSSDDWLAERTGTSAGGARAERERAADLAAAAETGQALQDGTISPEQAATVAAAARVDPGAEHRLLDAARRDSLAELRRKANRVRAAATDDAARRERVQRERSFRSWTNGDGAFCFRGQGLPEDGARLLAALRPHHDAAFAAARAAGRREPPEAYAYDALITLLDSHSTSTSHPHTGTGTGTGTGDGDGTGRTARSGGKTGTSPSGVPDASPSKPGGNAGGGGGTTNGADGAQTGDGACPGSSVRDLRPNEERRDGDDANGMSPPPASGGDAPTLGERSDTSPRTGGDGTGVSWPPDTGGGGGPGDSGEGPDTGDGASPRSRPTHAAAGPRTRAPAKIILHVDLTAMTRGHTVPGETCEIAGVGPVPVSVARDLLGDAFLALVIADGVDVRNVTHLGRAPTTHQRTALEARGMRCEVPGCWRTTHLEIDHVDGWATTRRTHVDQLAWLCAGRGGHHAQKTHDGFTLTGPPGNRTWHPPPHRRAARRASTSTGPGSP